MAKWIKNKFPKERTEVLVKRLFEDGTTDIRIGYLRYSAGDTSSPNFIVPCYEGEQVRSWFVVGWQKLPD